MDQELSAAPPRTSLPARLEACFESQPTSLHQRPQLSQPSYTLTPSHTSAISNFSAIASSSSSDTLQSGTAFRPARLSPLTPHTPTGTPSSSIDVDMPSELSSYRQNPSAASPHAANPDAANPDAAANPTNVKMSARKRSKTRSRSRTSSRLGRRNTAPPQHPCAHIRVAAPEPGTSLAALLRPAAIYPQRHAGGGGGGTNPTTATTPSHALPGLLNRVFGLAISSHLPAYLRISPSGAATSVALLTSFFSCPAGEMHLPGSLPPKLRALAAFASSTASFSGYWTGLIPHMPSALTGLPAAHPRAFSHVRTANQAETSDLLNDKCVHAPPPHHHHQYSKPRSDRRRGRARADNPSPRVNANADPNANAAVPAAKPAAESHVHDGLPPQAQVATELAAAMSTLPHTCTRQLVDRAKAILGDRRVEAVMLVASAMGFFSCWVDAIDISIDWESFKYLETHVAELGAISLGRHYDGSMLADAERFDSRTGRSVVGGAVGSMLRPLRVLSALRSTGGSIDERRQIGNVTRVIPMDAFGQREAFQDTCGFYFYWLDSLKDKGALRGFLGIIDAVLFSDRADLSRALKCIMCMVLARAVKNDILTTQFAYLAWRFGATEEALSCAGSVVPGSSKPPPGVYTAVEASALLLAHCMKDGTFSISQVDVRRLKVSLSHITIAESVTCLSVFRMIHRWTAANPSHKLEPVVWEFAVSEVGKRLKLPFGSLDGPVY